MPWLKTVWIFLFLLTCVMSETTESEIEDQNADSTSHHHSARDVGCFQLRYRTIDGTCNNAHSQNWGSTGVPYLRFLAPDYADGHGALRRAKSGNELPGPRIVSLSIVRDVNNEHPVGSHMVMQWGQLINHDISKKRSKEVSCCDDGMTIQSNNECVPIIIPPDDPVYKKRCLSFSRSDSVQINNDKREQINDVTGFIDASAVYGSTDAVARSLRTFNGGKLKSLSRPFGKDLLPTMASDSSSFSSGDSRTNMLPSLVIVHVLLLRHHNRLAEQLARLNPRWNDETLYQEARKIVIAFVQQITYREFLPMVLGAGNMRPLQLQNSGYFEHYDSTLNPTISNGFAVAAYRFGHSLVQSHLKRFTPNLQEVPSPPLAVEFFNVSSILNRDGEVDRIVLGLLNQKTQQADSSFSNQIHHNLFGTGGSGSDLYAINIQRGRDHGVPGYNFWRQFCGFPRFREFSELGNIMRSGEVNILQRLYNDVDDIDLYAAGMAEFPIQGGLVGPTFACIITRQFQNLRHGDRYWYENGGQSSSFTPEQLHEIRKVSLARLICDNMDVIERMQPEAMNVPSGQNRLVPCRTLPEMDLSFWIEGRKPSRPSAPQQQLPTRDQVKQSPQERFQDQFRRPLQQQSRPFNQPELKTQLHNNNNNNIPPRNFQRRPPMQTAAHNRLQSFPQQQFRFSAQSHIPARTLTKGSPLQEINSKLIVRPFQRQQQLPQRPIPLAVNKQSPITKSKENLSSRTQFRLSSHFAEQQIRHIESFRPPQSFVQNGTRHIAIRRPVKVFDRPQITRIGFPGTARPFRPSQPLFSRPQLSGHSSSSLNQGFSAVQRRAQQNFKSFQPRFSDFDNQVEPLFKEVFGNTHNSKPVHIFFTQGGDHSVDRFTKLRTIKPQPGVVFRVPGLSKADDEEGAFGYIATF